MLSAAHLASCCAFCDSPVVVTEHTGEPVDTVVPFRLSARQASHHLATHLAGRWLVPEALRRARAPDRLKGVLVPFWCIDAHTHSTWTARQGIHWTDTETYTVTRDGKTETRTRSVTRTEWFETTGTHVHEYTDHLVSGSTGLSEAEANALEPFDLGHGEPFDPALLAGWLAEQATVSRAEALPTARQELADRENQSIRAFLPADEVAELRNETRAEVARLRLVLLPVWVATYRYRGRVLRLLVNGQTGEVVAKLPTDPRKIAVVVVAVMVLTTLVLGMFMLLGGR